MVEPSFFAHELFNAFLHGKAPKKRQFLIHTKEIVCTSIRVQASRMAFAQRACWIQMIGQLRQELDRFPGRSEIGRVWLDETYIYMICIYIWFMYIYIYDLYIYIYDMYIYIYDLCIYIYDLYIYIWYIYIYINIYIYDIYIYDLFIYYNYIYIYNIIIYILQLYLYTSDRYNYIYNDSSEFNILPSRPNSQQGQQGFGIHFLEHSEFIRLR